MPEELWTELHDIVQEAVIKTIPKKKKCRKAKWLSEEVSQLAEKRREAKRKGEKERYIHLNAEFQKKSTFALLTMPEPLTVWIMTNWKILQEMGIPDHLTCLLRNLYAGLEATVRTTHGITD